MSEISRTALFGKLNRPAYKAIEGATVYCKMRGNPYVELVHWLHQILHLPDSDLHRIIRHFEQRIAHRPGRHRLIVVEQGLDHDGGQQHSCG